MSHDQQTETSVSNEQQMVATKRTYISTAGLYDYQSVIYLLISSLNRVDM